MSASSLFRTSSTVSASSSEDAGDSASVNIVSRRTRKRFTSGQLTVLENLFHQTSHPSREQREMAAKLGEMETKSVTIWFQNKRQTERKVALNNTANPSRSQSSSSTLTASSNRSSRPSLDRVATRSELPMAVPHTPIRQRNPNAAIWDSMLSSPIGPPPSPPSLEYVELGRPRRSLEWACAAARLSDKHSITTSHVSRARRVSKIKREEKQQREREKQDSTDDEMPEAITPPSTLSGGDIRWRQGSEEKMPVRSLEVEDDDMLNAALTLCGMGRK